MLDIYDESDTYEEYWADHIPLWRMDVRYMEDTFLVESWIN